MEVLYGSIYRVSLCHHISIYMCQYILLEGTPHHRNLSLIIDRTRQILMRLQNPREMILVGDHYFDFLTLVISDLSHHQYAMVVNAIRDNKPLSCYPLIPRNIVREAERQAYMIIIDYLIVTRCLDICIGRHRLLR